MSEPALLAAVFVSTYLGCAWLALSQVRHAQGVAGVDVSLGWRLTVFRLVGGVGLMVGPTLAVLRDGPGFGSLLGSIALSVGAVAVAMTLAWRPYWLRPLLMLRPIRAGGIEAGGGDTQRDDD